MTKDKKRDYLIKTLSRTKRKDYENYIVNAIYHKLGRLDIKPVTQQYVKRSDGKYALIDLYFPQINYGIECDEAYHIDNEERDLKRELTMEQMLDSVEETQGFILRRVKAYESIDSIEQQINFIVSEINDLLNEREITKWDIDMDPAEYAISKGEICIGDRLQFEKIIDIFKFFNKNYKGIQRCYFNIGNGYYIWCPKLAVDIEGKAISVSNGWVNTLTDDWSRIYEENELKELEFIESNREIKRITFAKSKDVLGRNTYRFIGIFKFNEISTTKTCNVYDRIDDKIDLKMWFE